MRRLLPALALACGAAIAASNAVYAYDISIWGSRSDHPLAATEQPDNNLCVPASSLTWINYINNDSTQSDYTGTAAHTKVQTWFDQYFPYNKYQATGDPDQMYGLDPRGWAWLMFAKSPGGYTYNDYRYTNQDSANWEIVYGVRITNEPVGVLVARGNHAIIVVGYSSTRDPQSGLPWALNGLNVIDPWYADGSLNKPLNNYHGADYDLTPDQYIAVNNWNSNYFKTYKNTFNLTTGNQQTVWGPVKQNGVLTTPYWVVVLRKDSTNQAPVGFASADPPYADSRIVPPGGAAAGASLNTADVAYGSLQDALAGGIASNQLTDPGQFSVDLTAVVAGDSVLVHSTDPDVSDYYLLAVNRGSTTVAVAMIITDADGFHFGGIAPAKSGFRMPNASDVRAALALPTTAAVNAEWRSSGDSPSPFDPVWVGLDAAGHRHTISMRGQLDVPQL